MKIIVDKMKSGYVKIKAIEKGLMMDKLPYTYLSGHPFFYRVTGPNNMLHLETGNKTYLLNVGDNYPMEEFFGTIIPMIKRSVERFETIMKDEPMDTLCYEFK